MRSAVVALGLLCAALPALAAPAHAAPVATQATPAPTVTLDVPVRVGTGDTVRVVGVAQDAGTVRILFRKRGQTAFTVRRTLATGPDGAFSTSFVADDDYRLYARTDRSASPVELVQAAPVLRFPATARRGSSVPVVVRAAPGTVVSVSFRRSGQAAFTVRRYGRTDASGRYATRYTADADYRYYADERAGQRSDVALTTLRKAEWVRVSDDPTFPGRVVSLNAPAVFPPGAEAIVFLTGSDRRTELIGRVRVQRNGAVSATVRIPTDTALGRASVDVQSGNYGATGAVQVARADVPSPTLELRGDGLGVTRVGDPKERAVAAVSRVLGAGDRTPAATRCVGAFTEVMWNDLFLAFDERGRLNGWHVTTPRLTTPEGVRVGTTVAQLRGVYGARLRIFPPNPDSGHTFSVGGVSMVGFLTGDAGTDRVTALANGACTGP